MGFFLGNCTGVCQRKPRTYEKILKSGATAIFNNTSISITRLLIVKRDEDGVFLIRQL